MLIHAHWSLVIIDPGLFDSVYKNKSYSGVGANILIEKQNTNYLAVCVMYCYYGSLET